MNAERNALRQQPFSRKKGERFGEFDAGKAFMQQQARIIFDTKFKREIERCDFKFSVKAKVTGGGGVDSPLVEVEDTFSAEMAKVRGGMAAGKEGGFGTYISDCYKFPK